MLSIQAASVTTDSKFLTQLVNEEAKCVFEGGEWTLDQKSVSGIIETVKVEGGEDFTFDWGDDEKDHHNKSGNSYWEEVQTKFNALHDPHKDALLTHTGKRVAEGKTSYISYLIDRIAKCATSPSTLGLEITGYVSTFFTLVTSYIDHRKKKTELQKKVDEKNCSLTASLTTRAKDANEQPKAETFAEDIQKSIQNSYKKTQLEHKRVRFNAGIMLLLGLGFIIAGFALYSTPFGDFGRNNAVFLNVVKQGGALLGVYAVAWFTANYCYIQSKHDIEDDIAKTETDLDIEINKHAEIWVEESLSVFDSDTSETTGTVKKTITNTRTGNVLTKMIPITMLSNKKNNMLKSVLKKQQEKVNKKTESAPTAWKTPAVNVTKVESNKPAAVTQTEVEKGQAQLKRLAVSTDPNLPEESSSSSSSEDETPKKKSDVVNVSEL